MLENIKSETLVCDNMQVFQVRLGANGTLDL